MKSFYELLDVAPTATADEIKRAFRQQIARYHPDKVQHLGAEFQEMAAVRAAELTQAYRTLSDQARRAEYDGQLSAGGAAEHAAPAAPASPPPSSAPPAAAPPPEEPPPAPGTAKPLFTEERAGVDQLLRRATIARFRRALEGEFGRYQPFSVDGFDVTCDPRKAVLSFKAPPRVVGRFVSRVDAASVVETWTLASRAPKDAQRDLCVFLLGPDVAPPGELASAIAGQRRRGPTTGPKTVLVPVNTGDWTAHVPTDAPPAVKGLLTRLKEN